jgi:hypothetical protein
MIDFSRECSREPDKCQNMNAKQVEDEVVDY